jgi:hypothetical protein
VIIAGRRTVEFQFGGRDILDPLVEVRPQVQTRDRLETLANVVEGRFTKAIVAIEHLQSFDELLIADLLTQHVPDHRGLAVTDGFGGSVITVLETR